MNRNILLIVIAFLILGINVLDIFNYIPKTVTTILYSIFSIIGIFYLVKSGVFSKVKDSFKEKPTDKKDKE